jgi:hypothetical protein
LTILDIRDTILNMIEVKIVPLIRERLAAIGRRPMWLSKQTGIDPSQLTRIMNGKMVYLETAFSISAALGVPIEQLWVAKEVDDDGPDVLQHQEGSGNPGGVYQPGPPAHRAGGVAVLPADTPREAHVLTGIPEGVAEDATEDD